MLIKSQALAKQCETKKRWSFVFVSAPLNTPGIKVHFLFLSHIELSKLIRSGGVASLANALAIQ